mgnify:CR=1 FL=1
MKNLMTFPKGGVHPPGKKQLAETREIKNAVIKSVSLVPMSQHLGSPAEPLVSVGDQVREEMIIGKATGYISANIHSPVPGTVKAIKEIFLPNGVKTKAIEIEMEGEFDRLGKKREIFSWESLSKKELLQILVAMGLVGLGGGTFPMNVKYRIPEGYKLE